MTVKKWYEDKAVDCNEIISTRIRLARNLENYLFTALLPDGDALKLIDEVTMSLKGDRTPIGEAFSFRHLNNEPQSVLYMLMEKHLISMEMVRKKAPKALLLKDDESVAIMLNEEDHIRIQTIFSGDNIEKAHDLANRLDDLIGESTRYAFDENLGYLTSCPTNVGTGMRGSYMLHLPALEMTGQIPHIVSAISKFGMTIRGIHGEGSKPIGSVYQLSNQITMGKSEEEIITALSTLTQQITAQEADIRTQLLSQKKTDFCDRIYRSYGNLKYARKISLEEAMQSLSDVRLGYMLNIITEPKPEKTIYNLMMDIQPGNIARLSKSAGSQGDLQFEDADVVRAYYIRENLK